MEAAGRGRRERKAGDAGGIGGKGGKGGKGYGGKGGQAWRGSAPPTKNGPLRYFEAWHGTDLALCLDTATGGRLNRSFFSSASMRTLDVLKVLTTRESTSLGATSLLVSATSALAGAQATRLLALEDMGMEEHRRFDENFGVAVELREEMLALDISRGEVQAFQLLLAGVDGDRRLAAVEALEGLRDGGRTVKDKPVAYVFRLVLLGSTAEAMVGAPAFLEELCPKDAGATYVDRLLAALSPGGAAKRSRTGRAPDFSRDCQEFASAFAKMRASAEAEQVALAEQRKSLERRERDLEADKSAFEAFVSQEGLRRFLAEMNAGLIMAADIADQAKDLENLTVEGPWKLRVDSLRRRLAEFSAQARELLASKAAAVDGAQATLCVTNELLQELLEEVNAAAVPRGLPALTWDAGGACPTVESIVVVLRKIPALLTALVRATAETQPAVPMCLEEGESEVRSRSSGRLSAAEAAA